MSEKTPTADIGTRSACRIHIVAAAMIAVCTALLPASLPANPSSQEPSKGLAAHGTIPGAAELVKSMYEIYNSAEANLLKWHEMADNPARLPHKQIGTVFSQVWKAQRDAQLLQRMGEPAGVDLYAKFRSIGPEIKKIALRSKSSPAGGRYYLSLKKQLTRDTPSRIRFANQANQALEAGKFDVFEKQMDAYGVKLYEKLAFFGPTEATQYSKEYDAVLGRGDAKIQPKRRAEYAQTAKEAMAKNYAATTEFLAEANRIRDEIASQATATLGEGVTGDTPQAFAHVVKLWSGATAGLIRLGTIGWVYNSAVDGSGKTSSELTANARAEANKLSDNARQALASIVQAAAQSTPADQVKPTYVALLKEISIVDRRSRDSVYEACQPALAKLAAKDPQLAAAIEKYDQATAQVLAWRQQFAVQQAKVIEKSFPPAANRLSSEAVISKTNKPKLFGGVSTRQRIVAPNTLGSPASWMVFEASTKLLGQQVSDEKVIRLTPTSRTAIVPHHQYHYLNVTLPLPSEAQVADLKESLLVDDAHPPLSILAADAISSAEMHDYQRFGGKVTKVHVEAAATRFIGLPDVAHLLAPMGALPFYSDEIPTLSQACWRLDVTPQWAQHKYFVVLAGGG